MTLYLDAAGNIRQAPPILAHLTNIPLCDAVEPCNQKEAMVIGLLVGISGKSKVARLRFQGVGPMELKIDRLFDSPKAFIKDLLAEICEPPDG